MDSMFHLCRSIITRSVIYIFGNGDQLADHPGCSPGIDKVENLQPNGTADGKVAISYSRWPLSKTLESNQFKLNEWKLRVAATAELLFDATFDHRRQWNRWQAASLDLRTPTAAQLVIVSHLVAVIDWLVPGCRVATL
jgi:hypothetical protein